jgi:hypothetical protein
MTSECLYPQAILNIIWAHQFLPETEFQRIADSLATAHGLPVTPIADTVGTLNAKLSPLGFEIRGGISEDDGAQFYAVCNLRTDPGSKLATSLRPVELLYFKALIKVIMTSQPSGVASLRQALDARLAEDQTKSISAPDANELIRALVQEHWLSSPEEGFVSIGPRCLLELKQYIENEYADHITECTVCSDLVFKGESCVNALCTIKLHHHCARTWFHGRARKCPTCTNDWPPAPRGWEDNEPLPAPRHFRPNAVPLD